MSDERKSYLTWELYQRLKDPNLWVSPLTRYLQGIEAKNYDPVMDQEGFAWGDPGTETGHTIGTKDTDVTLTGGSGNVNKFLRFQIGQTEVKADQNLTITLKVQTRKNSGTWYDVSDVNADWVNMRDDTNITHGNDTTDRLAGGTGTFLSNNQGVCDTSETQNASFTWTNDTTENIELLHSLQFVDANLSDTDVIDFRVVESDGTVLDAYTVADATATWDVPSANEFFVGMIPVK